MTKENYDNHAMYNLMIMFLPALILGPINIVRIARKWYGDFGTSKILKDFAIDFGPFQIVYLLNITSFSSYFVVTVMNFVLTITFILAKWVRIGIFEEKEQAEKILNAIYYSAGFVCSFSAAINNMGTI
jgi:hypothetical protein